MSDLLAKTRELCRIFEIKPARSKGQNFLINERIYDDIIKAAALDLQDVVLEVGPGLGFLTAKLARKVKRVIAVELDDQLADYLRTGIDSQDIDNVTVINQDILKFNLVEQLRPGEKYKVVANIPYNISSIFLRTFLSGNQPPESLVLMLQKEVAQRIIATPPDMSILAVSIQYYASAEIIREVKAGNFWPEPEVDSAIIKIVVFPARRREEDLLADQKFFRLVRIGFSAKRKMLKNNLAAGLKIKSKKLADLLIRQGLDPKIRAEELTVENWRKLFAALTAFVV